MPCPDIETIFTDVIERIQELGATISFHAKANGTKTFSVALPRMKIYMNMEMGFLSAFEAACVCHEYLLEEIPKWEAKKKARDAKRAAKGLPVTDEDDDDE